MTALGTWHQYLATISCMFCSMMTAVCFVWFTPLMTSGRLEVSMTSDELGWLVAYIEIGELFGPLPCGYIADRWGRKLSLLITFPLIVSSWIITVLTRSILGLYIARTLQGITTGMVYTIAPVYIAEIAHPNIRGELCGHLQTMWYIGVLYTYCTGPYLSYNNFTYASAVPAFLFFGTFVFMPETPFFLAMKGKREEARKSLEWLRGTINVTEEMDSIEEAVSSENKEKSSGWKDLLTSKQCRKPLFIVLFLCIVKYLAGTSTITNYATQTFSKGGLDNADLASIILAVVFLVTTIIAAFVTDYFGRKPLILISTLGVGLGSTIIAGYFYVAEFSTAQQSPAVSPDTMAEPVQPLSGYEWILWIGLAIFCIATNIGLGPVQITLQAEYFPSHVRAVAGALCTLVSNVFVFISIKQYQLMEDYIGLYSNYAFFAAVALLSLIVLCPFMEETAKKSLGEIQNRSEQNN